MTHSDQVVALRLHKGERGTPAAPPPRGQPGRDETLTRAAALCAQALAAARDAAPSPEVLWLAEQLADTTRILAHLADTGTIAAAAYDLGRADAARIRPA